MRGAFLRRAVPVAGAVGGSVALWQHNLPQLAAAQKQDAGLEAQQALPADAAPFRKPHRWNSPNDPRRATEGRPIFVGIAGGTGSGKTTVARAIAERLGPDHLLHISHDSYYRDQTGKSMEQRVKTNYDHPDALDNTLLADHLNRLRAGETVDIPQYDFARHTRAEGTETKAPARIILVEGILLFSQPELLEQLDIKIFVDTDSDLRFIRRLQRDIADRGRRVGDVIKQYQDTVRPMHNQFVEPSKRHADIIIPTGLNSVALEMVVARLDNLLRMNDGAIGLLRGSNFLANSRPADTSEGNTALRRHSSRGVKGAGSVGEPVVIRRQSSGAGAQTSS